MFSIRKMGCDNLVAPALWAAVFILCTHSQSQPVEIPLEDPSHDYAFLEFEPFSNFKGTDTLNKSQPQNWRIADQISFPAGHLDGHLLFGSIKNTFIDRNIVYNGQELNDGLLQRYWLCGGIELLDSPGHTSYLMGAVGVNSDFADLNAGAWNSEWIYTHTFRVKPGFRWGLGLDIQQYSGRFIPMYPYLFHKIQIIPYPLILLDWRISSKTKFVWDADFMELRQFFTHKFATTLGLRFNQEFFALNNGASYDFRSVGAEAGLQYSLWNHCYLRFKYKELLAGREVLGLPDGTLHLDKIRSGRSLRLNLAYGI